MKKELKEKGRVIEENNEETIANLNRKKSKNREEKERQKK